MSIRIVSLRYSGCPFLSAKQSKKPGMVKKSARRSDRQLLH